MVFLLPRPYTTHYHVGNSIDLQIIDVTCNGRPLVSKSYKQSRTYISHTNEHFSHEFGVFCPDFDRIERVNNCQLCCKTQVCLFNHPIGIRES